MFMLMLMIRPIPVASTIIAIILLVCCHSRFTAAVSEEFCLGRGFDPSNLSCDTCALLGESTTLQTLQEAMNSKGEGNPIDVVAECRSCCQAYKVNPIIHPGDSLRGKYRFALLTYNENTLDSYGEIKDFLQKDVDDVLLIKGENRFRVVKSEKSRGDANMMMMLGMMGGFGGGSPKLMLFEKQNRGGWTEEDEGEAGEVIDLKGWKREDVKDMLLTLLPNFETQ